MHREQDLLVVIRVAEGTFVPDRRYHNYVIAFLKSVNALNHVENERTLHPLGILALDNLTWASIRRLMHQNEIEA